MARDVVERLWELHVAPKNIIEGNLRTVTQAQLDYYYAVHAAPPDLLVVVEAAASQGLKTRELQDALARLYAGSSGDA